MREGQGQNLMRPYRLDYMLWCCQLLELPLGFDKASDDLKGYHNVSS